MASSLLLSLSLSRRPAPKLKLRAEGEGFGPKRIEDVVVSVVEVDIAPGERGTRGGVVSLLFVVGLEEMGERAGLGLGLGPSLGEEERGERGVVGVRVVVDVSAMGKGTVSGWT